MVNGNNNIDDQKLNEPFQLKGCRYSALHTYFRAWSFDSAFFAGLIASDGNICGNRIQISLTNDKDLLEWCKYQLKYNGPVYATKRQLTYQLRIVSQMLVDDLFKFYKIAPRKSLTYCPPDIDIKYRPAFAKGMFLGDGCVSVFKAGNINIRVGICGTHAVCEWFRDTMHQLIGVSNDIKFNINCRDENKNPTCYSITWSGIEAITIYNYLHDLDIGFNGSKLQKFNDYPQLLVNDEFKNSTQKRRQPSGRRPFPHLYYWYES